MTTASVPITRHLVEGPFDWRTICELLKAEQYEQVARRLQEAQVSSEQSQNVMLADVFSAAYYICLACEHCRAEVAWHEQAREAADRRACELSQLLDAIFNQFREQGVPELLTSPAPRLADSRSRGETSEPTPAELAENIGLWQRIQSLLGWRPDLRPTDSGARRVVAQALAGPVVESGEAGPPQLIVHCLGPFQVYQDDRLVEDWPSSKGKSIFKYLITHRERPVAKEVLMDSFWPDAHPDAARNNLNVAIYGLRQALHEIRPDFSHVLFQNDCYLLNPEPQIWVDVEAFREHLKTAQSLERRRELASAVREYRAAEALYQGEFLAEDRYEDWLIPLRQSLQADYLKLLDRLSRYYLDQEDYEMCVSMCDKMLAVDPCREEAHRRLMRCYARRGQRYLALRQYQLYVETLQEELEVPPADETLALYRRIRAGEAI
jgi:DNA-binding SARP family transcriptional activator